MLADSTRAREELGKVPKSTGMLSGDTGRPLKEDAPDDKTRNRSRSDPEFWNSPPDASSESHGRQPDRQSRPVVGLYRDATHRRFARRRFEAAGSDAGREAPQRLLLCHADDGVEVAGHADIGHEGGAAGQDPVIGAGRMGMRTDDEAGSSVAEVSRRMLFSGGFAMEVHDDRTHCPAERMRVELGADTAERILNRLHE